MTLTSAAPMSQTRWPTDNALTLSTLLWATVLGPRNKGLFYTQKVILLSESLKEAFSELDMTSEVLQITMSPSQPYFRYIVPSQELFKTSITWSLWQCWKIRLLSLCVIDCFEQMLLLQFFVSCRLSTFGNSGNAHYDYPKDSDMMDLFQCTRTQTNRLVQESVIKFVLLFLYEEKSQFEPFLWS